MRCINIMILAHATCACKRCGKTFERETRWWNSQKAREWEEWVAKNITLCPECRYDDYVAGAVKLAQEASAIGLSELEGSDKQVTWAEYIRAEQLESAETYLKDNWDKTSMLDDAIKERNEKVLHALGQILVQIRLEPSAAWWIGHRHSDGAQLLRSVYQEQHPEEIQF